MYLLVLGNKCLHSDHPLDSATPISIAFLCLFGQSNWNRCLNDYAKRFRSATSRFAIKENNPRGKNDPHLPEQGLNQS